MSSRPSRPAAEPASALHRGDTVDRYVILGLVGRGGMGEVYAAYDPELNRKVAIKLVRARSTSGMSAADARVRAHVNTAGKSIPLWLVSANPAIGWGQNPDFPDQEGTFFGNIMRANATSGVVDAYYCDGAGFNTSVVPGRIGYGLGNGAPYRNPFGQDVLCSSVRGCAKSPQMTNGIPDGYNKCGEWDRTITVWRRNVTDVTTESGTVRFDFETGVDGWSGPPMVRSTAQKLSGTSSLAATVSGGGMFQIRRYGLTNPPAPGSTITYHVWVPAVTPITSVSGQVTDGRGYQTSLNATNLKAGAWNTITVNVPAAAYAPINSVGVDVVTTAATTVYVDAVKW